MTAQRGRDLLLKIGADSVDQWRELLADGVKSASISGSGVFKDAASDAALRSAFLAGAAPNWQVVIPSFGTVQGPFKLTALQYDGPYNGEMKLSLSLASAGALSFTAA
jgi:TP901-1 family phage major tail protein